MQFPSSRKLRDISQIHATFYLFTSVIFHFLREVFSISFHTIFIVHLCSLWDFCSGYPFEKEVKDNRGSLPHRNQLFISEGEFWKSFSWRWKTAYLVPSLAFNFLWSVTRFSFPIVSISFQVQKWIFSLQFSRNSLNLSLAPHQSYFLAFLQPLGSSSSRLGFIFWGGSSGSLFILTIFLILLWCCFLFLNIFCCYRRDWQSMGWGDLSSLIRWFHRHCLDQVVLTFLIYRFNPFRPVLEFMSC